MCDCACVVMPESNTAESDKIYALVSGCLLKGMIRFFKNKRELKNLSLKKLWPKSNFFTPESKIRAFGTNILAQIEAIFENA